MNNSNCKYWDYWIVKWGGMPRNEVTKDMEKECCYTKDCKLCPDCLKYYLLKGVNK